MKGWKTWLGGGILAVSAALVALGKGYPEIAWAEPVGDGLMVVGGALGVVGVGHKVEKIGEGKITTISPVASTLLPDPTPEK